MSQTHLATLPNTRKPLKAGIVHIGGTSRFFRSHLASYINDLVHMGEGDDWGIYAVSLRNANLFQMLSQDDCYNLVELEHKGTTVRQIGCVMKFLYSPDQRSDILQKMTSSDIKIVSLTITANGYCLHPATGKLDDNHPDIQQDLRSLQSPTSALGYIVHALSVRRKNGLAPFAVLSCDNIPGNGKAAREAVVGFASLIDKDLANWIDRNGSFPNDMVDRITPKTPSHVGGVPLSGTAVVSEGFRQFVIEDRFPLGRPAWEKVGVEMVQDAEPYYLLKLFLLNGTHTVIGLLASQLRIKFVHQCFDNKSLALFLKKLIFEELKSVVPSKISSECLQKYQEAIMNRLSNPNIQDQVSRLTCDLTRKITKYIVPAIEQGMQKGASVNRLALTMAVWMLYSTGFDDQGNCFQFQDAQYSQLASIRKTICGGFVEKNAGRDMAQCVQSVFKHHSAVFDKVANSTKFMQILALEKRARVWVASSSRQNVIGTKKINRL